VEENAMKPVLIQPIINGAFDPRGNCCGARE
jgi:hypothetical protein